MKNENSTINLEMDDGSDRDEAEGDQDDLHPSSDDDVGIKLLFLVIKKN